MKTLYCLACGTKHYNAGEITTYIYCEKCGAKVYADGSTSYYSSNSSRKWMENNIREYEEDERYREEYGRYKRRR